MFWARKPSSLDRLGGTGHVKHDSLRDPGAACGIVGLCVRTDDDVLQVVTGLLDGLRSGSVIVSHGTGTPQTAARLTGLCARAGVDVLDAPVSGGHPGAGAKSLTTLVGGPEAVVRRCEPVFRSFSSHVVHLGPAGTGQTAKLFNNAFLMMNQAAIAEVVELALSAGMDPIRLFERLSFAARRAAPPHPAERHGHSGYR